MSVGDRVAYGFGVFCIITGIIIGFSWPQIFNYVIQEKLALNPSSETYKLWVKTPIPMYLEVYLFNWTNSEEFLKDKKIKPAFEEIGPFVFREVHQRVNINWNENDSVSYNQTRTWTFVPSLSVDLEVPIINLNVIATTITRKASGSSHIMILVLKFLTEIYKEKLLITRPAKEWLFDGMDDKLLDFIKNYIPVSYDKFGWFYGRNLSSVYDGRFNIDTGSGNILNLGAVKEWNFVNETEFYKGECGVVKGSSGDLFAPLRNQNDLSIFVTDFCGPLTLKYAGQKSVDGLFGHYYVGDKNVFDNGTLDPGEECFCTGECIPSGLRNVTSCRQAPLFVSFPHFYLADPVYTEAVTGMNPNKSQHEFYLSIDPLTGIPLEVRAQLQLNVLLRPLKAFPMFADVPKVFVPMMWFRQRAKVTPDLASRGKTLRIFGNVGLWSACGLGLLGLMIIITRLCLVKFYSREKHYEFLNATNETEETPQTGDSEGERLRNAEKVENGRASFAGDGATEEVGRRKMCVRKAFRFSFFRTIFFVFGLIFVTVAFFCSLMWDDILEEAIRREFELSSSSKSFAPWVQNPTPFFIDFYFFNWTNPTDLKQPGYRPIFEEVGPYRFREEIRKTDIKWNENKTVTYRKRRKWYFEPAGYNGSLDDVVTSINVVVLTAARSTRYWNKMARIPLSMALSSTQKVDITKSVRELLFEGFADPLIDFASKIPGLSSRVPFDRFGWFYKRNDSSYFDGVFNVETGAGVMDTLGELKFWNFRNRTQFYEGPCGDVKGSAGDFWPPQAPRTDKITLFSPDMCRFINFIYNSEETVGGLKGFRYESGPGLFDNGTEDPQNECFCGGRCYPSGVLNVSSCRFGAPAFVSYPHFYTADPFYLTSVEGLKPDSQRHETYIILEQKWRIPLEVAIRLQINILLESDPGIRMFNGMPTVFFPVMWFEQKVTITESMRREIEFLLGLPRMGFAVSVFLYATGFSCLAIYTLASCLRFKKS